MDARSQAADAAPVATAGDRSIGMLVQSIGGGGGAGGATTAVAGAGGGNGGSASVALGGNGAGGGDGPDRETKRPVAHA